MAISPGKTQKWLFTFSIHLAYHEFENNDEGTLYLTSHTRRDMSNQIVSRLVKLLGWRSVLQTALRDS